MAKKDERRKNPILIEFAKKVRSRRYELGLTQEKLAEIAEFHVNFIGGIERATRNPSLISIVKLASALKINLRDLIPFK
ncbi:MAG TPA: XRE family transcriptional regulator [Parachlamydiales bacterium]|nr:XRE family transcriptional regulator [Parachlamydiales bacterium]